MPKHTWTTVITTTASIEDAVIAHLSANPGADSATIHAIAEQYRAAVNAALPPGIALHPDGAFIGATTADEAEIAAAVQRTDLAAIVRAHGAAAA